MNSLTITWKQNKKVRKIKLQQKKQYDFNKKRVLIREKYKLNKEKKQKERKQKKENFVEDTDLGRFFDLATSNNINVNGLKLHEIKNETLLDFKGDFELNGSMLVGPVEHEINITFEIIDDSESYINAIDIDYDSEDKTFNGYVYKLNTPIFKVVKRSAYAEGTNYMQEIVEYHGQNCYIPTTGHCFIKCIIYFTTKVYKKELTTFIQVEKYRSAVMTSARIQPFCRNYKNNIDCFNGKKITHFDITQRNKAFFIHNNHFCLT